ELEGVGRQLRTNHFISPQRPSNEFVVRDWLLCCVDHHERRPLSRATVLEGHGVAVNVRRVLAPTPQDEIKVGALFCNFAERPMNEIGGMSTAVPAGEPSYSTTVLAAALAALVVTASGRFEDDFGHGKLVFSPVGE